jgi:hypothetical protein
MPVKEAQQQLGGISPTTFYPLVKDGELSLIKICRRSFVHSEELDDFLTRKRFRSNGNCRVRSVHPPSWSSRSAGAAHSRMLCGSPK